MELGNEGDKSKRLSVRLLGVLYVLVLFCLVISFPSENDQFVVPIYYLIIMLVLQSSFMLYYKTKLRSAAGIILILVLALLIIFGLFFYYITGLAAAFKN